MGIMTSRFHRVRDSVSILRRTSVTARALIVAMTLVVCGVAEAQSATSRYELGVRTRALERAWMNGGAAGLERRKAALPFIESAVMGFFSGNYGQVGMTLAEARARLDGAEGANPLDRFSMAVVPRLVDVTRPDVLLNVGSFYDNGWAGDLTLVARWKDRELAIVPSSMTAPVGNKYPEALTLKLDGLPKDEGDYDVDVELRSGSWSLVRTVRVSRARALESRLAALGAAEGKTAEMPAIEATSFPRWLATLRAWAGLPAADSRPTRRAASAETEIRATEWLGWAEDAMKRGAGAKSPPPGSDVWISVGEQGRTAVRVSVPATKPGVAVPLVLALHGAGGSENMWFDAYGDGKIVELCRTRGWLLASPGMSGVGDLSSVVDAIAERWPVDRRRVLIVGHSMGAAAGQAFLRSKPTAARAFAALGGGSRIKDAAPLKALPVFVGVGDRDFGRRGGEALHASLVAAGSTSAVLRIYPTCEHLMVVPDALPDVFAWFDTLSALK